MSGQRFSIEKDNPCPECNQPTWQNYTQDEYFLCSNCGLAVNFHIDPALRERIRIWEEKHTHIKNIHAR